MSASCESIIEIKTEPVEQEDAEFLLASDPISFVVKQEIKDELELGESVIQDDNIVAILTQDKVSACIVLLDRKEIDQYFCKESDSYRVPNIGPSIVKKTVQKIWKIFKYEASDEEDKEVNLTAERETLRTPSKNGETSNGKDSKQYEASSKTCESKPKTRAHQVWVPPDKDRPISIKTVPSKP